MPELQENIKQFKEAKNEPDSPWYQCDYATFKSRMEYIKTFYDDNPIITPLIYKHFDELKSIDLYSLGGEFDFLLDDSIELAKKWKGNMCLDLLETIMHGYFYFEQLSAASKESVSLTVKRLQKASGF